MEGITLRSLVASTGKSEWTIRRAMARLKIRSRVRPAAVIVSEPDARRIEAEFKRR